MLSANITNGQAKLSVITSAHYTTNISVSECIHLCYTAGFVHFPLVTLDILNEIDDTLKHLEEILS
jgi:uncharacterized protein YqiB (DUF1249 family)